MNEYYFFEADGLMVEVPKKVYQYWDVLVTGSYSKKVMIQGQQKELSIKYEDKKNIQKIDLPFTFCDGDIFKVEDKNILCYYDFDVKKFMAKDYLTNEPVNLRSLAKAKKGLLGNIYEDYIQKRNYLPEYKTDMDDKPLLKIEENLVYTLSDDTLDLAVKKILNMQRIHSLTLEEWHSFRIELIKKVFSIYKSSGKNYLIKKNLPLEGYISKDIDSPFSDSQRKIAVLESILK